MRKHTTAALREGHRVVVVDNVVGVFDSASLAAAITTPAWADRILGKTESATLPNRTMILLSGNNLCLSVDMPRRVLVCRIDPQTDRPYAREFALNPKRFCLANRQALVAAALTLIRSYLASGA